LKKGSEKQKNVLLPASFPLSLLLQSPVEFVGAFFPDMQTQIDENIDIG